MSETRQLIITMREERLMKLMKAGENIDHDEIREMLDDVRKLSAQFEQLTKPIPMVLFCPMCHARHVDAGEFITRVHHTHACQVCGVVWRPAVVPTVGVQYLPGYKDSES